MDDKLILNNIALQLTRIANALEENNKMIKDLL